MPATKRKRSSGRSYRRSYKRRGGVSVGGVVRALAKANASMGPFGPGSANYEKYGPSKRQMLANPGLAITPAQKQQRMLDRYYGDGDYWSDFGRNVGHWGSRIGGAALGAMRGAASGGGIVGGLGGLAGGWEQGAGFSKMMGWGDYNSAAVSNQIMSGPGTTGDAPVFINPTDDMSGDVIISNREYIGPVISSNVAGKFTNKSYKLNPADAETFPFLSQLAHNFELFEWQGLGFQYVPLYGEGGSSNALGKLILATNYDPEAAEFKSSIEMQNYDYSTATKPSVGVMHGIETAPDKRSVRQMYCRDSITRDKMFTDLGNFQVASEGVPVASLTLGELWVTYRVKFSRSKLRDVVAAVDGTRETVRIMGEATSLITRAGDYTLTNNSFVHNALLSQSMLGTKIVKSVQPNDTDNYITSVLVHLDKANVKVGDIIQVDWFAGISYSATNASTNRLTNFSLRYLAYNNGFYNTSSVVATNVSVPTTSGLEVLIPVWAGYANGGPQPWCGSTVNTTENCGAILHQSSLSTIATAAPSFAPRKDVITQMTFRVTSVDADPYFTMHIGYNNVQLADGTAADGLQFHSWMQVNKSNSTNPSWAAGYA